MTDERAMVPAQPVEEAMGVDVMRVALYCLAEGRSKPIVLTAAGREKLNLDGQLRMNMDIAGTIRVWVEHPETHSGRRRGVMYVPDPESAGAPR